MPSSTLSLNREHTGSRQRPDPSVPRYQPTETEKRMEAIARQYIGSARRAVDACYGTNNYSTKNPMLVAFVVQAMTTDPRINRLVNEAN